MYIRQVNGMAWNSISGEITSHAVPEDEIWAEFNGFFSSNSRKTATYKYGFLKSILDNLFSCDATSRGMELTFQQLFEKFTENYWNLILKYNLRQMSNNGKSAYSGLEKILIQAASENGVIRYLEYSSLQSDAREALVLEVKKVCKRNVVGALYGDFDGKFYGFSLKEERIWISTVVYAFLLKYKLEIEKLNYYAWAKLLEKINAHNPPTKLVDKLELATPKRNNLSFYRRILQREFEEQCCFYCGRKLNEKVHVDHVIPWQLVREDRLWNFVLACPACNIRKNNRLPKKEKLELVIQRNEIMRVSDMCVNSIAEEFKNYSGDMMVNLWQYAKMGGFREWI